MKWTEIVTVIGALIAIASFAIWIGALTERVDRIQKDKPVEKVKELIKEAKTIRDNSLSILQKVKELHVKQMNSGQRADELYKLSQNLFGRTEQIFDKTEQIKTVMDDKLKKIRQISQELTPIVKYRLYKLRLSEKEKTRKRLWRNADFCFLTRIGGAYNGFGEWVRIYESNDSWFWEGRSIQSGRNNAQAEVTCVKYELVEKR